jgi:outer membrane receptor protein involved in Fe transport
MNESYRRVVGVIAFLVGLLGPAVPEATGQTALLIGSNADEPVSRAWMVRVLAHVGWPAGPVAEVAVDPCDTTGRWTASLQELRRQARVVVVVPFGMATDGEPYRWLVRQAVREDGARVRIGRVVSADEVVAPDRIARRIEVSAAAAADLGQAGTRVAHQLSAINVTATREDLSVFRTATPVTVLDRHALRVRGVNGIVDVFREIKGLDVEGVGANQRRPLIRGLQGQRILLLEDGLRLNNSRRRQDSGELPALVDVTGIERIEVVRGASSVLYGSDAIGGVLNVVTRTPEYGPGGGRISGSAGYRFSTVDRQSRVQGSVSGHVGRLAVRAGGSYRHAGGYEAPGGRFGDVELGGDMPVNDTGVDDYSLSSHIGYRLSEGNDVFIRYQRYRATDAGFGFVDPSALGELATVQLLFPRQDFNKISAGYRGTMVRAPVADRVDVVAYGQSTGREFLTNVDSPLPNPPGAGVGVETINVTDLDSYGFRVEANKMIGGLHAITYGVDLFRDRSTNTDSSTTTLTGFGPPQIRTRDVPRVPNATLRSMGLFMQGEVSVVDRIAVTLGLRYQDVHAETNNTPKVTAPAVDATDRTVVGAGNVLVRATDNLNLVASVGRGFRSPNLVERFFSGPSPEGRGFWTRNPDLDAETSLNLEVGARFRSRALYFEGFLFRNTIRDGIRIEATGDSVDGVAEFQNVNVDELRYSGVELSAGVDFGYGISLEGSYTRLDAKNVSDPDDPVLDTYADKVGVRLRYTDPRDRIWAEYSARYSGRRDIPEGSSPVGAFVPAFTVHALRGGVRLIGGQHVAIGLENLTNTLYAEAPNVGFFRPEPKRNLVVSWRVSF